jgi:hypothetical protein
MLANVLMESSGGSLLRPHRKYCTLSLTPCMSLPPFVLGDVLVVIIEVCLTALRF